MGQSATLYRITQDSFEKLKKVGRKEFKLSVSSKEYVTFQKTFMGLEFVLSKDKSEDEKRLIQQIFNPNQTVGGKDFSGYDLTSMDEMALMDLFENDTSVYYNPPETTQLIEKKLSQVSETSFIQKFDPDELNSNEVYPWAWNRNTEPDTAFNERDILNEFIVLKNFYHNAAKDQDYVLCFVG